MFKIVKRFYDRGIYSKDNIKTFVIAGRLTAEQYEEITGDKYEV